MKRLAVTTLTLRRIKGHFIVTGPDIPPMQFKSRPEPDTIRGHSAELRTSAASPPTQASSALLVAHAEDLRTKKAPRRAGADAMISSAECLPQAAEYARLAREAEGRPCTGCPAPGRQWRICCAIRSSRRTRTCRKSPAEAGLNSVPLGLPNASIETHRHHSTVG